MNYLTIVDKGRGEYKEKGSKFIGLSFPVESVVEAQKYLEQIRKEYHDARHHCYAYIIGMTHQDSRANDDGEPGHSAGDPILGQIRSRELTNTLVVVVRYFGGTKLGVSGLIHAYKTAAEEALKEVKTEVIFEKSVFTIEYTYEQTSLVERLLSEFEKEYLSREFTNRCRIRMAVRMEMEKDITNKLKRNDVIIIAD